MSEQAVPQAPHPGRPSKYTPQVVGKMLGTLQAGLSVESSCEYAGINPDTHYQWIKDYPEYSEKVSAARMYGTILAGKQIQDILQDTTREKPKYSETTRATISKWWMEKKEKKEFGSQSIIGAKVESDGKGGQTATVIYATDESIDKLLDHIGSNSTEEIDGQFAESNGHTEADSEASTGTPEDSQGQLLEVPAPSSQEEDMAGGTDQGGTPPVHSEELRGEHTNEEGMPQP